MSAADLLGPHGPLARALPHYEHRPEQLAMAALVERALADDAVALVEAGTGTGKTLAYLVPAVLSGKRVVVSTGTKTLEDQIMQQDLPLLEEHLGVRVSAAMMKGLGNYLCLRRYEEFVHGPDADRPPHVRYLPLLTAFRDRTYSGERSEFTELPEDNPLWSAVQSGSDTRIGQRCPHYEACFVTRMRRRAEEAQIIVVNHHLFFADLALRGQHGNAGAIPDYDAVIFDEAHQIEDVVTDFFGVRVSSSRLEVMVRDADRSFRAARIEAAAAPILQSVLGAASMFFAGLPRQGGEAGKRPLERSLFEGRVKEPMLRFDSALEELESYARLNIAASEAVAQVARRAQRLRNDVALIAEGTSSHVTWTETRGHQASLGASPVEVAEILRKELFERGIPIVLTSATLGTANRKKNDDARSPFTFVKERLGIEFAEELSVPSPFDYARQAALYLPQELPDPRDPAYVEAAAREIVELIELTGGGAFVLCTSLRMMNELYRACAPHLHAPALLQGMAPKSELLDTFKARGDAVLFASQSFWEGVDVPGRALRLVVIDKLPFEVPSDPLVRARCERLEARGEAPFMGYLVPDAALRLKQGFGRLVRTAKDRGIVAVLDRRLTAKGYGRVFLNSLPDASRCYTLAEVRAFWEEPPEF
jgi:ATP-dependent DNA helicase DinG